MAPNLVSQDDSKQSKISNFDFLSWSSNTSNCLALLAFLASIAHVKQNFFHVISSLISWASHKYIWLGVSHLSLLQEQVFSGNDAFFAWTFMKRQTLWQAILAFSWPLVALAMCLFPVYPYQCKIVVLYTCAGALLFIVSMLISK